MFKFSNRKYSFPTLIFILFSYIISGLLSVKAEKINRTDPLLGSRVSLKAQWIGNEKVKEDISILVLAGHADSQGLAGAGTAGEAVDIYRKQPMNPDISDELFWNLKIRDKIVEIGQKKGLNVIAYDPPLRNIDDANNEKTNWSVGAVHSRKGGYVIEIHFDSYRQYGFGSGLIPPLSNSLNKIDEALAKDFGRYPLFFRGGLGAPRRGIRILEIGKLEGNLEKNLRNKDSREKTLNQIASQVVASLIKGISYQSKLIN